MISEEEYYRDKVIELKAYLRQSGEILEKYGKALQEEVDLLKVKPKDDAIYLGTEVLDREFVERISTDLHQLRFIETRESQQ